MNNIKLTQLSSGAGWACKIGQEDLAEVLKNLNINEKDFDDCSIYDIDSKKAIIQSVDFFTPIVDDPYEFGQIAAANSLSDIYAMGAKPLFALNIAGFPSKDLDLSILSRILEGGQNIASKAKINILGGHTIKDKEPKYGLVVTGIADKKKIIRNNNAKPKDDLVLTKPIGTGIIATAIKKNLLEKNLFNQTIDSMKELNMNSANLMQNYLPNACTDITGFGLIGHLLEMTKNSNVSAEINYENIIKFDYVEELAYEDVIPGGSKNNFNWHAKHVLYDEKINNTQKLILSDAQTSGGLLISVPRSESKKLVDSLNKSNKTKASIIGKIIEKSTFEIKVNEK